MYFLLFVSCGKEFLEVKSDVGIGSPQKEEDYLAIIQSTFFTANNAGSLGYIGGDECFMDDAGYASLNIRSVIIHNGYLWADDVYEEDEVLDWNNAYAKVQTANLVLDGLKKLTTNDAKKSIYDAAKGQALFFRAFNHFQVAQLFCKPYNKSTAKTDLGIPLRLENDVTTKVGRASVETTYGQIINDLEEAVGLLTTDNKIKINPSKQSALALLARVYLNMEEYGRAGYFAQECLKIQDGIIDYNGISTSPTYTFTNDYCASNPEVLVCTYLPTSDLTARNRMRLTPDLESLYLPNDLRYNVFYSLGTVGNQFFRGSFLGGLSLFNGLTTTEMMLISAESYCRDGQLDKAVGILNALRVKRFKKDSYVPLEVSDEKNVLKLIYDERRMELAFRGVRWSDLRRYNKEPDLAKDIVRVVNGTTYTLRPNDPKYTWQIPKKAMDIGGFEPNER